MRCKGIIDTGADRTTISDECAHLLGLVPIGKSRAHTASGDSESNIYIVDLVIAGYIYHNVEVHAMNIPRGELLIGMDIIGRSRMLIDNADGKYILEITLPDTL